MRTALFLLLLLAIGAIPGSTFPQRSIDPARTAAVDRRPPHRRARAGPAGVLRGLRVAVVRGHLPAAVRLAHRLRPAAHADPLAPGAVRPAAGAPAPGPARRPPRARRRRRPGRGPRAAAGRAAGAAIPRARARRHDALGREGLPPRDRQPRLPRRAHRHPRRRRVGAPARLEGRRHRPRGQDLRQHAVALRHLQPRPVGRRQRPRALHDRPRPAHRRVRDADAGQGPVRCAARLRGLHHLHGCRRPQRAAVDPGEPAPRDRGRLGLPPRQRLRPDDHGARRRGHGPVLRRDAVPAAGQQLHLGRGGQGARRVAAAARLRGVLPADRRDRRRAGPALGLPRRARPPARADRIRGRPLPRRAVPVGLLPRHRGDDADPGGRRRRPAAHPPAARRRPTSSPTAAARSPSTGSSASPASRSAPTRASR